MSSSPAEPASVTGSSSASLPLGERQVLRSGPFSFRVNRELVPAEMFHLKVRHVMLARFLSGLEGARQTSARGRPTSAHSCLSVGRWVASCWQTVLLALAKPSFKCPLSCSSPAVPRLIHHARISPLAYTVGGNASRPLFAIAQDCAQLARHTAATLFGTTSRGVNDLTKPAPGATENSRALLGDWLFCSSSLPLNDNCISWSYTCVTQALVRRSRWRCPPSTHLVWMKPSSW